MRKMISESNFISSFVGGVVGPGNNGGSGKYAHGSLQSIYLATDRPSI